MTLRKRKIIILSIVISILVVALLVGGIVVYSTTDLLKSNEDLFLKYAGEVVDSLKYVKNTQLSQVSPLKVQKPYTINGILTIEKDVLEDEKKAIFNIGARVNNLEDEAYAKIDLVQNNQNLFETEFVKSNNIYAFKSDEIANSYIGIENKDLKNLTRKIFNIYDVDSVPNEINMLSINDIFEIAEEENEHIRETYLPIIKNSINKNNFTKENDITVAREGKNYNTTGYRLTLNGQEQKELQLAILDALEEDSITLNLLATKASMLGLDDKYTTVTSLVDEIEKEIRSITNYQPNEFDGITITIFVSNNQVITTEIIIRKEYKFTIYGTSSENVSSRYILYEDLNAISEFSKIEIKEDETRSLNESTYDIDVNVNNKTKTNINIVNSGSLENNKLNTTVSINIMENNNNTNTINYEQEMIFQNQIDEILKLDRTNCAVLNDYGFDQTQEIINALKDRIDVVYNQKLQALGTQKVENIVE